MNCPYQVGGTCLSGPLFDAGCPISFHRGLRSRDESGAKAPHSMDRAPPRSERYPVRCVFGLSMSYFVATAAISVASRSLRHPARRRPVERRCPVTYTDGVAYPGPTVAPECWPVRFLPHTVTSAIKIEAVCLRPRREVFRRNFRGFVVCPDAPSLKEKETF